MHIPEFDITGRKMLLIGASRGVGQGIAEVLAEAGAEVAIASINVANARAAAQRICAAGGKAVAFAVDASRCEDVERLSREVLDSFGPLDALVNCVGDSITRPLVSLPGTSTQGTTEEDWRYTLDVNLTPAFAACRAFGPHFLRRQGGSVINISTSIAAYRSRGPRVAYVAAKAGVIGLTEALAVEWGPFRVRVNSIAPGAFPDAAQLDPEIVRQRNESAAARVPMGRTGRLREVGLLALYLASDASSFVTGQTWVIDGGAGLA